jgi:multiple sugar transport system ATP-binding protein
VLHQGRLQQCDTPRALYERPVNTFVAGFIGSPAMNIVTLPLDANGAVSFGGVRIPLPPEVAANGRAELLVGLRPESLELSSEGMPAQVEVVEELGADAYVFCVSEVAGERTKLVARTEAKRAPERGERVSLRPRAEDAQLFDPETGDRLER